MEEQFQSQGCATNAAENVLPTKPSVWTKIKNVLFYDIRVELTPQEQKVEDEINEFLHQEVTFKGIKDFFLQEIHFGSKK